MTPNQFVTNVNTLGVVVTAQPLFSNLGGTLSLAQTSMSSGKLLGRYSAATGAIQEITPDGVTVFLDSGTVFYQRLAEVAERQEAATHSFSLIMPARLVEAVHLFSQVAR